MARRILTSAARKRIDEALREMIAAISAQPVPDRLLSIIDQIDDEAPPAPRKVGRQG
ncbi:NepR family anti-sigma factor [Phenylobacterium sp.]|jgi:hypothetical protein|uniref:NepR family anti-sigma factor n=1 Tax=Phenylobacterium sp. TaxID=1871053 RepID=UPI002F41A730